MNDELRWKIANLIRSHVNSTNWADELPDQILALIKEAGYVKLADDQNLPEYHNPGYMILGDDGRRDYDNKITEWKKIQQDMLDKGWRKVELEVSNG